MKVELNRKNKLFHFEATNEEKIRVNIDASPEIGGENKGVRPMELVLMGLGGCASIDLGLILKKQRQELDDYKISIEAQRTISKTTDVAIPQPSSKVTHRTTRPLGCRERTLTTLTPV